MVTHPEHPPNTPPRGRLRSAIVTTLGTVFGVALLWWLLRRVDAVGVWQAARQLSPWGVLAATLVICSSIPLRALQWRWLLDGAEEVTPRIALRAICLGNVFNSVIPARGGELAKAWVLSRGSGLPMTRVLTSLVIARVLDLGCVLVLLGLVFVFVPIADGISVATDSALGLPVDISAESLNTAMKAFAAAALGSAGLLVVLGLNRQRFGALVGSAAVRLSPAAARVWSRFWDPIEQALGVIRSPRHLWGALGLNVACWTAFVLTPLPMLLSLGLEPTRAIVATLGVVGLTTLVQLVPTAPAALGTFHASCLLALVICCPEIDAEQAIAFTLVLHPVDTLAAAIPGLFLLPRAWGDVSAARRER